MGKYTDDLIQYLNASPTAFHAAAEAKRRLEQAGFTALNERESWALEPGSGYFVVRQDSSVIAFRLGTSELAITGFRIAASHTDSPGLRIKVDSESIKAGALRVTVEVYGGPIRATWMDRELAIAGRVLVGKKGEALQAVLFDTVEPYALIPNVAIHLNRDVNKGVELNAQTQMKAILGVSKTEKDAKDYIRRLVAEKMNLSAESVGEYDLFLYPCEQARYIGSDRDMFVSGRIDNLGMSHAVLTSLIESEGEGTSVGVLFDSEEIGSQTWQGAQSSFLRDVLKRIHLTRDSGEEEFLRTLAGSYLVSGDAAHAVHPNYADKHDESFQPELNKGPVVKIHAGQRYTTTAESSARFLRICGSRDIPVQKFIGRSDVPSGGTIGPITSSRLGIPSVDVGNPIWGMHSARETGGSADQDHMIAAVKAFYEDGPG